MWRLRSAWCEGATREGRPKAEHASPIRARPVGPWAGSALPSAASTRDQDDGFACLLCTVAELLLRLMSPVRLVAARALGELAHDLGSGLAERADSSRTGATVMCTVAVHGTGVTVPDRVFDCLARPKYILVGTGAPAAPTELSRAYLKAFSTYELQPYTTSRVKI